jgi:hypothetical protein
MYGDKEEELLASAKKHGIEVHGYTEETWNEEIAKNVENFRQISPIVRFSISCGLADVS